MCKHIHAACLTQQTSESTIVHQAITSNSTPDEVKEEIKFHTDILQAVRRKTQNNCLSKISLEITALVNKKLDISDAVATAVAAHLRVAKRILQIQKPKEKVSNLAFSGRHEPANKLVTHQKRFYSVKRVRNIKKLKLSKPAAAEQRTTGNILMQEEKVINDGTLDHSYLSQPLNPANVISKVLRDVTLVLGDTDILIISNTGELSDTHMEIGMSLLKHQFPIIGGMESTLLSQCRRGFSVQTSTSSRVVQIHHTGTHHWVTSTRDCDEEYVRVYDSLLRFDRQSCPIVSTSLSSQLSQIYRCTSSELPVLFPDMSHQYNSVDCGVYALATATDICFNRDPSQSSYHTMSMRAHLLKCFEQQLFEPFPASQILRTNSFYYTISVFCYCRMPHQENMVDCVACFEWFHYECITYTGGDFTCSTCLQRAVVKV